MNENVGKKHRRNDFFQSIRLRGRAEQWGKSFQSVTGRKVGPRDSVYLGNRRNSRSTAGKKEPRGTFGLTSLFRHTSLNYLLGLTQIFLRHENFSCLCRIFVPDLEGMIAVPRLARCLAST